MGAQESKIEQEHPSPAKMKQNIIETAIDNLPATPILTSLDPRSPSVNIARTPVELFLSGDHTPEIALETTITDTPKALLGIDPRSPTVEFMRTPIVVSVDPKKNSTKLENKNFDNVRKSMVHTTPVKAAFMRHSRIIPPKLLDSSPLAINPNVNKRKSFVGLLETNIDFTETNLDQVALARNNSNSEIIEFCGSELSINNKSVENDDIKNDVEVVPESFPQSVESTHETIETKAEDLDENIIEPEKVDKTIDEKSINLTAHVKDFDKKLTNLIYQDESEDDSKLTQRFEKLKGRNRTPLAQRNGNNEDVKKSFGKLKVSDKPLRKQDISKIPVFKDFKMKGVQCENTPPRNQRNGKITKWDAEKTLII